MKNERTNRREIAVHVKDVNDFWAKLLHEAERENEELRLSAAIFEHEGKELTARLKSMDDEIVRLGGCLQQEEARRVKYQEVHAEAVRLVRSATLGRSSPVGDVLSIDASRPSWERLAALVGEPHDKVPVAPGVSPSLVWEVFKLAMRWDETEMPEERAACFVAITRLFEQDRTRKSVGAAAIERAVIGRFLSHANEGDTVGIALDGTPVRLREAP